MFVRMLTVHCDQNNSYEININGFQVRKNKRNKKRNFRSLRGSGFCISNNIKRLKLVIEWA